MDDLKELQQYLQDSMDTIRAVKGDAYGDALLFLNKSINVGMAFNAALDPEIPASIRDRMNDHYSEVMEFAFCKVLQSLNISEAEADEIWKWQEVFTNRKHNLIMKRRLQ
jgi:hypothetical protein